VPDVSNPLTLSDANTFADALAFFEANNVSGAPVVNNFGLYVGWISLTTLIKSALVILETETTRNVAWCATPISQLQLWTHSASPLNQTASMALTLGTFSLSRVHARRIIRLHF
jgi:hypothetical protein